MKKILTIAILIMIAMSVTSYATPESNVVFKMSDHAVETPSLNSTSETAKTDPPAVIVPPSGVKTTDAAKREMPSSVKEVIVIQLAQWFFQYVAPMLLTGIGALIMGMFAYVMTFLRNKAKASGSEAAIVMQREFEEFAAPYVSEFAKNRTEEAKKQLAYAEAAFADGKITEDEVKAARAAFNATCANILSDLAGIMKSVWPKAASWTYDHLKIKLSDLYERMKKTGFSWSSKPVRASNAALLPPVAKPVTK